MEVHMHCVARSIGSGLLLLAAACSSTSPTTAGTTGTVVVRLTDAPNDDFQSATVFVSQVSLATGDNSATATVLSSTKASFDLLTLQNGVTAQLASAPVPTGSYTQLRLVVDSARVVLAAGKAISQGSPHP